jgi:hypothetical protein
MVAAESADRNVSLRLENDQLRAEVERLTNMGVAAAKDGIAHARRAERAEASLHALRLICGTTDADKFTTWCDKANARADKAEAELATERARLEWLEQRGPWESWNVPCGEAEITLRGPIRTAIDSAMKEGAK